MRDERKTPVLNRAVLLVNNVINVEFNSITFH